MPTARSKKLSERIQRFLRAKLRRRDRACKQMRVEHISIVVCHVIDCWFIQQGLDLPFDMQ